MICSNRFGSTASACQADICGQRSAAPSTPPPSPLGCLTGVLDLTQVVLTVLPYPVVHCGDITVGQGQTMQLLPLRSPGS